MLTRIGALLIYKVPTVKVLDKTFFTASGDIYPLNNFWYSKTPKTIVVSGVFLLGNRQSSHSRYPFLYLFYAEFSTNNAAYDSHIKHNDYK